MKKNVIFMCCVLIMILHGISFAYESAYSSSYSPITAISEDGNPVTLYWKYEINNGLPVSIEEGSISPGYLELTIDHASLSRDVRFGGNISGQISGECEVQAIEHLNSLSGGTYIEDQEITLDISVSMSGQVQNITMNMLVEYNSSAEWFLDRDNLGDLPVGYVYDEQGMIEGTAHGSIVMSGMFSENIDIDDMTVTSQECWEIIAKHDTLNVGGRIYRDVVEVKRNTVIPKINDTGITEEEAEIIYWVARGVGMVKSFNQYEILGQPLTIELVDTNLMVYNDSGYTEYAPVGKPVVSLLEDSGIMTISWDTVINADHYFLYYALPDADGQIDVDTIGYLDLDQTSLTFELWPDAAFYVALLPFNNDVAGELSDVMYFEESPAPAVPDYQGAYSGTYAGDDRGTWSMNIDSSCHMSGSSYSSEYGVISYFSGTINSSGEFNISAGGSSDISLQGTIDSAKNVQGTWYNPDENMTGTLTGGIN